MSSIYKVGEQEIVPGKAWTAENGTQHPANWNIWSAAEKAEQGITEIVQETPPDSRLYTWSYNDDGTITSSAKSLDSVKSDLIAEVKAQQRVRLSKTDWAVIRKSDVGTEVPDDIATYRAAIRTKATEMEAAIIAAADIDAIAALFVRDDADGNKSGILYDWPELA